VNSFQFMIGKLFGNGLIGLFQFGIWGLLGSISSFYFVTMFPEMAKGLSLTPGVFGYFIIFFVLGYFFYSTFYAIVGAVSATSDDAQQLQMPFTMAIIGSFILAFMAINSPDSQMTMVLSHIPFFTPIVMFTRILTSQPPLWEIGLAIIINIFSILLMIAIAAKIFRIGILMYGKRPNIPEIFKWLRR
ncbi:MAG: ABC transporter permease, partial [Calditrichia bacterium]|nr:ABC transporter permease [Calditrichia bacterium]